jgi:hypothetical protein
MHSLNIIKNIAYKYPTFSGRIPDNSFGIETGKGWTTGVLFQTGALNFS